MKTAKTPLSLVAVVFLLFGASSSFADPLAFSLPTLSLPTFELPEIAVDLEIPTPDLEKLWDDLSLELIVGPEVEDSQD